MAASVVEHAVVAASCGVVRVVASGCVARDNSSVSDLAQKRVFHRQLLKIEDGFEMMVVVQEYVEQQVYHYLQLRRPIQFLRNRFWCDSQLLMVEVGVVSELLLLQQALGKLAKVTGHLLTENEKFYLDHGSHDDDAAIN